MFLKVESAKMQISTGIIKEKNEGTKKGTKQGGTDCYPYKSRQVDAER